MLHKYQIMGKFFNILIFIGFILYPSLSSAQLTDNDTIKVKELNEVVVHAQMQSTSVSSTTYTPTKKQKTAAQNAVDLLRMMAIPQIQINPITDKVSDNSGEEVTIFINHLHANEDELKGLRTSDVKKVEFLEFPTDPRFRGAQRVINIIVNEYTYGGYTKISANEKLLIGLSSQENIFSKFTYKKMTYDLYIGVNNINNHHTGEDVKELYSLEDTKGDLYTIIRDETLQNSLYRQNQYPISFRATYNTEKFQMRNMIAFNPIDNPANYQKGMLNFSVSPDWDYSYERSNPGKKNFVSYSGSFFISLPRKFSLDISPRLNYSHNKDNLTYTTSNSTKIIRNAKENVYNFRLDGYLQKRFGQKHIGIFGINGGDNINRLNYSGTDIYSDRFHYAFLAGLVGYQLKSDKVRLYADFGLYWNHTYINGMSYNDTYPFIHINFGFSPNSKNSLSLFFQYSNATPNINQKTPDILQDNELSYITGNPFLKNSRNLALRFNYTWIPSNFLSLNAYSNLWEYFNRFIITYDPYNNGTSILQTYINSGNLINEEIGLSFNWKFLNNNLQFYVNPKQKFYKSTGNYHKIYTPFSISAQISYYLSKFYILLFYQSPEKMMMTAAPQIYKSRNYYTISTGWSNSNLNFRITLANIFNKGWGSSTISTESKIYTNYTKIYSTDYHPSLNLSLTYTFGYGKKVQRSNEIGEQSNSASSAILK